MCEILFRGKNNKISKWHYGGIFHWKNGDTSIIDISTEFTNTAGIREADTFIIKQETVGQYTGIDDKNGHKIFEGDILICERHIGGNWVDTLWERGYVEYKYGAFGLHRKEGFYRPFKDWLEDYEYEVIGNIYDNPELLKEDEKHHG